MKKTIIIFFPFLFLCVTLHSQLMVTKLLGKNGDRAKLGFGLFAYYDIPLQQSENSSLRIELLDLAYFPPKDDYTDNIVGYINIKLGYKHVFSETMTGFYVEPQAGFGRVIGYNRTNTTTDSHNYGDGLALAFEAGYSQEIAESGNTLNFGLKYEADMAGSKYSANSLGLRVSYSFHLFRRRDN
jgi:hypothetical protein